MFVTFLFKSVYNRSQIITYLITCLLFDAENVLLLWVLFQIKVFLSSTIEDTIYKVEIMYIVYKVSALNDCTCGVTFKSAKICGK